MGLQKCALNLNSDGKELRPHGTLEFPCAGYLGYYTDKPENIVPWHWHEEFEIIYIEDGALIVNLQGESYCLEKGDCLIINSNMLHSAIGAPKCELHSMVFHSMLITGGNDSVFAKKYILPLISCNAFSGFLLKADMQKGIINHFTCAFEALVKEIPGFEFIVKENLSRICFFLYQQFESEIQTEDIEMDQDNLRIRNMLAYIHRNFSEELNLPDIAKSADIGERECLRCFQRTIQLSPMQYLLKYRVMQGAGFLLSNQNDSISKIAMLCGFDSPSNFAKMFKRFYSCTPRDYRKSNNNREKQK